MISERDGAAVQAGGLLDQVEAESGATLACVGAGGGIKTLEQSGMSVVGNASAFVAHTQFKLLACRAQLQMYRAAVRAEVDGVIEQRW